MSTRAYIGILHPDETIQAIYCHNNGDPEFTGKILKEHYASEQSVKDLINLGDISSVGPRIKPNENEAHSYGSPCDGVTVAYVRDRQEDWDANKPRIFQSKEEYADHTGGHLYLFDTKQQKWLYASRKEFRELTIP